jgi:hypothetical protein
LGTTAAIQNSIDLGDLDLNLEIAASILTTSSFDYRDGSTRTSLRVEVIELRQRRTDGDLRVVADEDDIDDPTRQWMILASYTGNSIVEHDDDDRLTVPVLAYKDGERVLARRVSVPNDTRLYLSDVVPPEVDSAFVPGTGLPRHIATKRQSVSRIVAEPYGELSADPDYDFIMDSETVPILTGRVIESTRHLPRLTASAQCQYVRLVNLVGALRLAELRNLDRVSYMPSELSMTDWGYNADAVRVNIQRWQGAGPDTRTGAELASKVDVEPLWRLSPLKDVGPVVTLFPGQYANHVLRLSIWGYSTLAKKGFGPNIDALPCIIPSVLYSNAEAIWAAHISKDMYVDTWTRLFHSGLVLGGDRRNVDWISRLVTSGRSLKKLEEANPTSGVIHYVENDPFRLPIVLGFQRDVPESFDPRFSSFDRSWAQFPAHTRWRYYSEPWMLFSDTVNAASAKNMETALTATFDNLSNMIES